MTSQLHARKGSAWAHPTMDPDHLRLWELRAEIERELERMIDILDQIDGDCDLEPSFGYQNCSLYGAGADECEPDEDLEPSLGWSTTGATGTHDGVPHRCDLEEEHDGREPDEDFEDADDNGLADHAGLQEHWGARAHHVGFYRHGYILGSIHVEPYHCWTVQTAVRHG